MPDASPSEIDIDAFIADFDKYLRPVCPESQASVFTDSLRLFGDEDSLRRFSSLCRNAMNSVQSSIEDKMAFIRFFRVGREEFYLTGFDPTKGVVRGLSSLGGSRHSMVTIPKRRLTLDPFVEIDTVFLEPIPLTQLASILRLDPFELLFDIPREP